MSSEAKPDRWMPLFIGDYKKDTGRLTRDQHGGYLLLIMEYWNTGPLPDDDEELAAVVLADAKEWRKLRPKLERFFTVVDGFWRHKRIDAELARWSDRKAKAVERAEAAAAARWGHPDPRPPKGRKKDATSTATSNASSIALSIPKAMLEQCPQSQSQEVDAHKGQSTLLRRERPEARADGASGLRVVADIEAGEDGEWDWVSWMDAVSQAEKDLEHFEKTDPEFASEIAEFLDYARAESLKMGRAA